MRSLRPLIGIAFVSLLVLGLVAPAAVQAQGTHAVPKVVIIVGPSGVATPHYKAAAREAAAVARRYTPDVVSVITPQASWPQARRALQNASLVVYLGHGNGWPSKYRSSLYPPTQNGLGLNPVAGGNDEAHQYFGEAYLEREVRLAPNAVVVMSHLCYASGNSEPGLPEGTLAMARQRVDNFGAGWIGAGAKAVVAEAYLDPAYYVRAILSGRGTVTSAWYASPTFHDHVLQYQSQRRDGFIDLLDPAHASGPGFQRSLVIRGSVASLSVVNSGKGTSGKNTTGNNGKTTAGSATPALEPTPPPPTLASAHATVGMPAVKGLPVAGATRSITLPIALPAGAPKSLVDGLQMSVRWDPLDVPVSTPPGAAAATAGGAAAPSNVVSPATGTSAAAPAASQPAASAPAASAPAAGPAASGDPAAAPDASAATEGPITPVDPFALVVPEVLGDVVDPVPAKKTDGGWRIRAALPEAPGLYALTIGLHDKDGVAVDAASQALVKRLLVRVVGPHSATVITPDHIDVSTQETFALPIAVQNSGAAGWAMPQPAGPRPGSGLELPGAIRVTARWLPLGGAQGDGRDGSFVLQRTIKAGERFDGRITLVAPSSRGSWLLVLDVRTPETPSLVAAGSRPTFVRVVVGSAPSDDMIGPPRP